VDLILIAGLSQ